MRVWFLVPAFAIFGCSETSSHPSFDASADVVDASSDASGLDGRADAEPVAFGFVDVTEAAGLNGMPQWDETHPVPCYLTQSGDCTAMRLTGGVAVRDIDGDGLEDLFLTQMEGRDRLLRNTGGAFVDIGADQGIVDDYSLSNSAAFADIDNDGDPDLYVGGVGEWIAKLYIMEDGVFAESAEDWGATLGDTEQHTQMSSCFGDMDLDGRLDLHTTEWRHDLLGRRETHAKLLRNTTSGFEDVTESRGASMLHVGRLGVWSFTSSFLDLNSDRFPELLVAADFRSSRLFWNEAGSTFVDGTVAANVGTDENGMGSALGDIDRDGDLDWFISSVYDSSTETGTCESCDWDTSGNRLYRYDGDREFTDITDDAGVRDGGWGWGARFFDYDLDGDLDLILTNGVRWTPEHTGFHDDAIRLWENDGTGRFEEVAALRGIAGRGVGRGLVTFDYDGDGDEDVLVMNNLDGPRLWRNDYADGRAWLVVRPVGTLTNRDGFGAVVRVWPTEGAEPIVRHAGNGCGFLGHTPGTPRFGLGDLDVVHQVEVLWPITKARQRFVNVPTRQVFEVVEEPVAPR